MLQNAKVTALTVSELSRENQQGVKPLPPTQIRVKIASCAAYGDLGLSLLLCSLRLFASLILVCKFALILPGRNHSSHEKKI